MRIAILEDDPDQLALLKHWLAPERHDMHGFLRGRALVQQVGRESFDLYILDWQVPDLSGIEVLEWLRGKIPESVPILFTTVRDAEEDIVFALNSGADDYMIKPLRKSELIARVTALLRRAYPRPRESRLSIPPYELDLDRHELSRSGQRIELTPKEFELCAFLLRNVGKLLSRGHLLQSIWGKDASIQTRTLDTHVSQVRKKVFAGDADYRLNPVYNYGYRLERTAPEAPAGVS